MEMYGNPYPGRGEYPIPADSRDMIMRRVGMGQPMQRTALMDLDAFLAGLSSEERAAVLNTPEFAGANSDLMQGFVAFMMMGEPGRAYLNAGAKEQAERLLLLAKELHAQRREESRSEVDQLKQELADLKRRLGEGGNAA